MKKSPWLLISLIFLFLFLTGIQAERASASESTYPHAPAFILKDLGGKALSLSDYKGKVLFLSFWATWCPPCRVEIPDFVELYNKYKSKGMEIIGISLDRISLDSLLSFVQKFKITYPVAFGTEQILDDYRPGQYIPVTIAIDKSGRIRHKQIGLMDRETLENLFLILSEEK